MCSMSNVLSYFTFNIWECPLMKSFGGRAIKLPITEGSYLPGYPPICLISTSAPSTVKRFTCGNIFRISCPSMLP